MDKIRNLLKNKVARVIFISLFLIWTLEEYIVVFFFYAKTHGRINKFIADHTILLYPMFAILLGLTAFFMYIEWNRGKKNHSSSILKPYFIGLIMVIVMIHEAVIFCLIFI